MRRLLNKAFALSVVFCAASLSAQPTQYRFAKLKAVDTISDAEYQKAYGSPDVQSNNFLVSRWVDKNKTSLLVLFKKKGESWVVFPIHEEQYAEAEGVKLSEDEKYLTYITTSKASSRGHFESYSYFCIIDLEGEKAMSIFQQSNDENWEVVEEGEKGGAVQKTGCSAQIIFLGKGNLTSVYTASKDFKPNSPTEDCLPKGQYKIQNDILVKVK